MGNGFNSVAGQEAKTTHNRLRPSVGLHPPDILNKSEKKYFIYRRCQLLRLRSVSGSGKK
jgi:hypothetical protein